eukprot:365403-Chlamydomonas_euryale.AAC.7
MAAGKLCCSDVQHMSAGGRRLGDDDRLDAIIGQLRQKAPPVNFGGPRDARDARPPRDAPRAGGGEPELGSEASYSAKSELAHGLRAIKGRIRNLEDRLALKKKSLAAGAAAEQGARRGGAR